MKKLALISIFLLSLLLVGLIFFSESKRDKIRIVKPVNIKSYHRAEPSAKEFYDTVYSFSKKDIDLNGVNITSAIAPHHLLAGDMIAEFYENLSDHSYDTIILLGPNHFLAGEADLISSSYDWQTPFGVLKCDSEMLKELEKVYSELDTEPTVMKTEHAITSHAGFIKKTFPDANFLPLILHPNIDSKKAERLAEALALVSKNKKILLIASVDFSHYTDSSTAIKQDMDSIEAISNMDFDRIYTLEVDSPPSIYTTMKYAELNNSSFSLLNSSNSALLSGKYNTKETTSYITGYFTLERKSTKILFLGDMMFDRYVEDRIEENGLDYLFEKLEAEDFFSGYNIISANLEGTVINDGKYYEPEKKYDFAFDPELIKGLKKYNINFFTIANNHFTDQGDKGMQETRDNLDKLKFKYAGCHDGVIAECSNRSIEINDKKISMVALSSVGANLDKKKLEELITKAASTSDMVIVNMHWGEEYEKKYNKKQKELAHKIIDYGADIIIGHHPHVIQGVEIYKNKPIFYSLGNFIFDQYFSKEAQIGLALELYIEEDKIKITLFPSKSRLSQVELMNDDEKEIIFEEIIKNSFLDKIYEKQIRQGIIFIN